MGEGVGHYPSHEVNGIFQNWKWFVDIREFEKKAIAKGLSPDVPFIATELEVLNESTGQFNIVNVLTVNPKISGTGRLSER